MSTINLTTTNSSRPVPVQAGQYLLAVIGAGGGDEVQLNINIGDAVQCPVTDALFTEDGTKVVWLPSCTIYATPNFEPHAGYGVALAKLSTKLGDT